VPETQVNSTKNQHKKTNDYLTPEEPFGSINQSSPYTYDATR